MSPPMSSYIVPAGALTPPESNPPHRRWAFGDLPQESARSIFSPMQEFTVRPQPDDPRLTRSVTGIDHEGRAIETAVVMERPLTLFLNRRAIVTMMTMGDSPDYLAVGYLLNQNMLRPEDRMLAVDYDDDIETIVVRTA